MDWYVGVTGWAVVLLVLGCMAAAEQRKNAALRRRPAPRPQGNLSDQRWHDLTLEQGVYYGPYGANTAIEELLRLHGYNRTADAWKAELARAGCWEKTPA